MGRHCGMAAAHAWSSRRGGNRVDHALTRTKRPSLAPDPWPAGSARAGQGDEGQKGIRARKVAIIRVIATSIVSTSPAARSDRATSWTLAAACIARASSARAIRFSVFDTVVLGH